MSRATTLRAGGSTLLAPALIAIGVIALLVIFGIGPLGGADGRQVVAEFSSAREASAKTPVRTGGVEVGSIEKVELAADKQTSRITMRIEDPEIDVRSDATAALRFRTLLGGGVELELNPGSPSAPPLQGAIPASQTRSQVEVDDVLTSFDPPADKRLKTTIRELPKGFEGRDAGRVIERLSPALRPGGRAMKALQGRRADDLAELVLVAARTGRALDGGADTPGRLVGGLDGTFSTIAGDRAELGAALRAAPGALSATIRLAEAIDEAVPDLNGLVGDLGPGAGRLEPAVRSATPALAQLERTLRASRPLLRSLDPALDGLGRASRSGRSVLGSLSSITTKLRQDTLELLERTDPGSGLTTYASIGPTAATLGSGTARFDDHGQLLHFPLFPNEQAGSAPSPCTLQILNPTADQLARCDEVNEILGSLFNGLPGAAGAGR